MNHRHLCDTREHLDGETLYDTINANNITHNIMCKYVSDRSMKVVRMQPMGNISTPVRTDRGYCLCETLYGTCRRCKHFDRIDSKYNRLCHYCVSIWMPRYSK